jgi:hypothetical protein
MASLIRYGQVEVELTLDQPDTSKPKVSGKVPKDDGAGGHASAHRGASTSPQVRGKYPKKTVPAGRLYGQILFEGKTPEYHQIGILVERKPGITYLAVRINSASKLIPADPNGASDPFVVVEWDGMQQETKVILRLLSASECL